jgi:catechol 2,3-dioxygenase-like lactoylglutathione lyase family enzyme
MISVRKIAHASYETPDLEKQVAYYTEILGLTLTAKEKDAAYLANTVDHHAVVLRRGAEAKCVRIGFQLGPDEDLGAFEKQTAAHGIKTARRKDSEPTIADMLTFEDPKGMVMEVFKRPEPAAQKFQRTGVVPHKLGHVAFHVADVKHVTDFYCDVLGFRVSDWMGDFFSFLAAARITRRSIWSRPGRTGTSTPPSRCATVRICRTPAISSASTATRRCGGPGGTASVTIFSPITAARTD